MKSTKVDIFVYADWIDLQGPHLMGILSAHQGKGKSPLVLNMIKSGLKVRVKI
jgi:serine/threonine-protein kinase HipA